MNFFKAIEVSFRIRPVFLRTLSYLFILSFIVTYFVAHWFQVDKLIAVLSFTTSSSVFWIIIILIVIGHLDFLREIVKDVARSKISEFATTSYLREFVTQLLNDQEFKEGINRIIKERKLVEPELPSGQEELDTRNKL